LVAAASGSDGRSVGLTAASQRSKSLTMGRMLLLSVLMKRVAAQIKLPRLLLLAVDCTDEGAAFTRQHGLCRFGVAELAAAVRVATGIEHATRGEDVVEAVLGIGRERALEGAKLRGDDVAALRWLVLKDRELVVSVKLDVAVVRSGKLGNDYLEASAVGGHQRASEQLLPVQPVDSRE